MSSDREVSDLAFRRRSTPQRKLMAGTQMNCPRCKRRQDILAFVPLALIEEYADQTCVIYKCSLCRWLFAPHPAL
jgi:hypothetical protein